MGCGSQLRAAFPIPEKYDTYGHIYALAARRARFCVDVQRDACWRVAALQLSSDDHPVKCYMRCPVSWSKATTAFACRHCEGTAAHSASWSQSQRSDLYAFRFLKKLIKG